MPDPRYAPAYEVRRWALETGRTDVRPGNGRLAHAVIVDFNEAHPLRPHIDGLPRGEADEVRRLRRVAAGEPEPVRYVP